MPNFDRTGPQGQGSMTGKRRGLCLNSKTQNTDKSENKSEINSEVVLGLGRGGKPRGGGGIGNCFGNASGKGGGRFDDK